MKKILALVLVMAVAAIANPVEFTYSVDGNEVTISFDAPIVGLGLDVDCDGDVEVTDVAFDNPFINVFMDYAYDVGETYEIGDGHPIALQDAAGPASLPSASFAISAGGLEDEEGLEPAAGTIVLTISGTAGTITITENALRGGVVDYDGAMDVTGFPMVIEIEDDEPPLTPEQELWLKMNIDGGDFVNPQTVSTLVGYINTHAAAPFYSIPSTDPAYNPDYDINDDGFINPQDVSTLVGYINTNGVPPFYAIPYPE